MKTCTIKWKNQTLYDLLKRTALAFNYTRYVRKEYEGAALDQQTLGDNVFKFAQWYEDNGIAREILVVKYSITSTDHRYLEALLTKTGQQDLVSVD